MLEALKETWQCLLRLVTNNLLKKYNQIWKKVKKFIENKIWCELVYGDNNKYIKTNKNIWWQKKKTHANIYQ